MRFLQRCSPTLRAQLLRAAGERWIVAKDSRSGLWGAQERARKALVHANKVTERAKRALRACSRLVAALVAARVHRVRARAGQSAPLCEWERRLGRGTARSLGANNC